MLTNEQLVRRSLTQRYPRWEIYRMLDNVQSVPFGIPRPPVANTPIQTKQMQRADYFDITTYELSKKIMHGERVVAHWEVDVEKRWVLYSLVN